MFRKRISILSFVVFLALIASCFAGEKKQTICLNMIVKNEGEVICRSLASVKPFIDYWVIVDTGSTDGTQDTIRNFMKDIPGELYERPWKNFGHNRMEALDLAKDKADYFLFIDADDWLDFEPEFSFLPLEADMYRMWRGNKSHSYLVPQLIKNGVAWKWKGVLHNYITCDEPYSSAELSGVKYVTGNNGARSKDPKKFYKNAAILEEALKDEPENARYVFYLGESYRDAGEKQLALKWYMKRSQMGGWDQEVFWSLLQTGILQKELGFSKESVINTFQKAHRFRPHRGEPLYYLAKIYNEQKNYALTYAMIKSRQFLPRPSRKDDLFNLDWIEKYGLDFLLAISAYWLGHYEESQQLTEDVLKKENLPENWKEQAKLNLEFATQKLKA